ncbi:restriction endonuclease subunit S [Lactobacillus crispatus]|uniref:restriction endonuclease subunit S n=1 Tax=Lactobacillus crispatus TaxID=47770 RepID=UPI00123ACAF5|nr:restriction endonuclease subunit S [Lactobacillus crispatus]KAA8781288.1 restriction endonuclease subunit S [Lactobacillus crispatus]KAA8792952.1 restriction endonuclease subunit S [Lactobacillus crispatus]KAA8807524.1 restriction endonuclease subunit S [Lactobacillus crispatus]
MKTNTLDFDAQALREKILDLAMRGKLVPQDPNDEPASVLLEKIKAEKEQLIKDKKIKKSKPLAPITDDERPFDIPDSWEWVRLGDVAKIEMGQAPKSNTVNQVGNGIEFHQGKTEFSDEFIKKSNKFTTLNNKVVNEDYILMAVRAPVGDVNLLDRKIYIGRGLAGIKGYKIDKNYLFRYLMSEKAYYESHSSGSTFKAINGNVIKDTPVPLPPLEEQSRIAAKIAQLFALLRKVESSTQQYAKLQTLLKSKVLDLAMRGKLVKQDPNDEPASVLLEKIKAEKEKLVKEGKIKKSKPLPPITDDEKPFDIPDSWEWVRLGELVDVKGGKRVPKGSQLKDIQDYKPYIRVSDMKHGTINTSKLKYATKSIYEQIHNYFISSEDIYFSIAGTIGKVGEIPQFLDGALLTENASKLVLFDDNKIKKDYLIIVLGSELIKLQHRKVLSRVTQPKLALSKLKNTIIPFPPLSEQNLITKKIRTITKLL